MEIRTLTKEYFLLIKQINEEYCELLNLKFKEAKNMLSRKIEQYCDGNSPDSGFEVHIQKDENSQPERFCDVQLDLFNKWEETIMKYSHPKFNNEPNQNTSAGLAD